MIGELDPSETEAAVALWEACGLTRPWNDPRADIELALSSPAATILAGQDDGALVATVMVGCDRHRGWVYYLAVQPDCRRAGWGRRMMAAAEEWLRERGAPRLNLMVRTGNEAVLGFYAALGYVRSDVTVLQRTLGGTLA